MITITVYYILDSYRTAGDYVVRKTGVLTNQNRSCGVPWVIWAFPFTLFNNRLIKSKHMILQRNRKRK